MESVCRNKTEAAKPSVKYLQGDTSSADERCDEDNTYATHDFFPLKDNNLKDSNYNLYKLNADPMWLKVNINNVALSMEIDSGTYVTVISELTKNKLFAKLKINTTNAMLYGYDEKKLRPV